MTNRSSIRNTMGGMRSADMPFRRGQAANAGPSHDVLPDKSADGQVRKAARSGKLDIASLDLDHIPSTVYTTLLGIPSDQLSRPPPPVGADKDTIKGLTSSLSTNLKLQGQGTREQAFGIKASAEEWSEPEELTSFKVENNMIREIDIEVGAFGGLKVMDLSHNQLTSLPNSLADLLRLASLNMSHNALTSIPPCVLLLPKLEVLNLSHNALTTLTLTGGIEPSDEGLSYGAGFLSTSFSRAAKNKQPRAVLPVLRSLDLSYNKLTIEGLAGLKEAGAKPLPGMRVLNLEQNALDGMLNAEQCGVGKNGMGQLASLNLKGNRSLQGVEGELAEGCKVDLEGTASGGAASAPGALVGKAASSSNSAAAEGSAAPKKAATSSYPIIQPNATIVYKITPAASFDSLPLKIDMDVYLPPIPSPNPAGCAVVIWFHGGGLLQGNKENLPPHFRRLPSHAFSTTTTAGGKAQEEGCIVISPNYRLAPQCPIIDILGDVRDCIAFVRSDRFRAALDKAAGTVPASGFKVDPSKICLSGGSAGGYLAMMASIPMPRHLTDEAVGGYRGEEEIKCCAPFYPITDLTHAFWATKTDPVPWWSGSIPHEAAKPHLNPRDPPVCTAISSGPRSILYPYMLQHALFPSLLFLSQRSIGSGLDGFRPDPLHLSVTHRLETLSKLGGSQGRSMEGAGAIIPPTFLIYGDVDDKINPLERDVELLGVLRGQGRVKGGEVQVVVRQGADHGFDESPEEECAEFKEWLGKALF